MSAKNVSFFWTAPLSIVLFIFLSVFFLLACINERNSICFLICVCQNLSLSSSYLNFSSVFSSQPDILVKLSVLIAYICMHDENN